MSKNNECRYCGEYFGDDEIFDHEPGCFARIEQAAFDRYVDDRIDEMLQEEIEARS